MSRMTHDFTLCRRNRSIFASFAVLGLLMGQVAFSDPAITPGNPGDVSGIWMPDTSHPTLKPIAGAIPFTTAGAARYKANVEALRALAGQSIARNDMQRCLPYGPLRILQQPFPMQIIQSGNALVLMYEHNHVFEIAYLDQPPDLDRDLAYMGNSVAKRERDAMLVTTTNFKDGTFLDDSGWPHSDHLVLSRKFRVIESGRQLEIVTSITDPIMYRHTWSVRQVLQARPEMQIEEYTCGQGPTLETRYTR